MYHLPQVLYCGELSLARIFEACHISDSSLKRTSQRVVLRFERFDFLTCVLNDVGLCDIVLNGNNHLIGAVEYGTLTLVFLGNLTSKRLGAVHPPDRPDRATHYLSLMTHIRAVLFEGLFVYISIFCLRIFCIFIFSIHFSPNTGTRSLPKYFFHLFNFQNLEMFPVFPVFPVFEKKEENLGENLLEKDSNRAVGLTIEEGKISYVTKVP